MVRSEKKIDEIIELELKELAKWATPRKTQVISDTGTIMDTESEYFLIVTKKGCIKKVSVSAVEKSKRKEPGSGHLHRQLRTVLRPEDCGCSHRDPPRASHEGI